MWIIADVLEFVVGNPQTAEHPRLNLDENTQSQDLFHDGGRLGLVFVLRV